MSFPCFFVPLQATFRIIRSADVKYKYTDLYNSMKKYALIWLLLLLPLVAAAQKLTVERMEASPMDLSASTQPRNDKVGNPCALVKVQLAAAGAQFEGNVIGDVAFRTGEYWVYISEGSYMLNVKHPNFLPLFVNFRDYGIKRVESKVTYVLTLVMPQGGAALVQTQKLTINYTPTTAMVIVDSKPYQGNGKVEIDLPVGSHDYQIVAVGYATAEGSVKLNADMPRTVTEHLVATGGVAQQPQVVQQQVVQQQPQVVQQQPQVVQQQPQAADEFAGLTAQQIADIAEDYYWGTNGKTKDYAQAVKWARKAAEMGNSRGQFRLGYCYDEGLGVTQDYAEAVKWYRKAIEQGHATAQNNLGFCYYNGHGVTQDYAEAVKWYRKAAEQGYAQAQNNLGTCYYNGEGVTQDRDQARELWRKAAAQGHQTAKENLKKYFGE